MVYESNCQNHIDLNYWIHFATNGFNRGQVKRAAYPCLNVLVANNYS